MAYELDTHRFLQFNLSHTNDAEDFHYVDIAKMLSAVNRQTFRQGMSYDVASIVFHNSADDETLIHCCTAPNTWTLQAAWQRGFREWMKQQNAARKAMHLPKFGPWHDFKVYLNYDHIADPDKPTFVDVELNTLTAGEWVASSYEIPQDGSEDPTEAPIMLMGPNQGTFPAITHVSLLDQLQRCLDIPKEDPNVPDTISKTVWALMSADQSDSETLREVIESVEDDNDFPPYSKTIVPGAGTAGAGVPSDPWIVRTCCIPGGGSHMAAVGGFTVPCGLLVIETKQDESDTIGVTLELVPGDYKGVSARPMRGGGR